MLASADVKSLRIPNMSREQIAALCGRLTADAAGTVSFHELQKWVLL